MSEPLLGPDEAVDYFDIWAYLACDEPIPGYVVRWRERSASRKLYLNELEAIFIEREGDDELHNEAIPLDLAEMISRMIVDINDIAYRERQAVQTVSSVPAYEMPSGVIALHPPVPIRRERQRPE